MDQTPCKTSLDASQKPQEIDVDIVGERSTVRMKGDFVLTVQGLSVRPYSQISL